MNVTLPTGLKLSDWTDQIVFDLDSFGAFGKLMDKDWQAWGVQFVSNPGLSTYSPPNPYQFSDWNLWAERFVDALS